MGRTNYEHKGEAFTRLVEAGKGPRTVRWHQRHKSGREYFTRVAVQDCGFLSVAAVREALDAKQPGENLARVSQWAVEWLPQRKVFCVRPADEAESFVGLHVALQVTMAGPQWGWRLWLTCPICGRRCGTLYASEWDSQGYEGACVAGCRKCLGLTDWAKQNHKRPRWAAAVLKDEGGELYQARSENTKERALDVHIRGLGVMAYHLMYHAKTDDPTILGPMEELVAMRDAYVGSAYRKREP